MATVIFKFRLIFATDERRIMLGMAFHCCVLGKPIDPCQQKKHGSTGFPQSIIMKGYSRHKIILRSSIAKIERNLKMTVFQEMGIESKLYPTKFNDLGIILFYGRCVI